MYGDGFSIPFGNSASMSMSLPLETYGCLLNHNVLNV